jgi:hypothetical protein
MFSPEDCDLCTRDRVVRRVVVTPADASHAIILQGFDPGLCPMAGAVSALLQEDSHRAASIER